MSSPDYSQAVKDIIDSLGDSPTPDAIYHAVRSYSVDHVVAAAAAAAKDGGGGGGGSQTLAEVLAQGNTAEGSIVMDGENGEYLQGVGDPAEEGGGAASVTLGSQSGNDGGQLLISAGGALVESALSGDLSLRGGDGWGGSGARLKLFGGGDSDGGRASLRTDSSLGSSGQALVSDGSSNLVYGTLGSIKLDTHAAPADGELAAGELRLWIDQTNGAAKLMVKAKTADGTVVTAAVALA